MIPPSRGVYAAVLLAAIWVCACRDMRGRVPDSVVPRVVPSPDSGEHQGEGTRLLVEEGKVRPAAEAFARALAPNPADPSARLLAAWTAALLGDEEDAFRHLLVAGRSPQPDGELALWTAYRLFVTRAQAEDLAAVMREVSESSAIHPTTRARAHYLLGQTLRYLGDFAGADRAFAALGYPREWMLCGPFDNDQNAGFDTAYPPEVGLTSYGETYSGKLHEVSFRKVTHFDYDGRINLSALLDPARWTCAYLVTFVRSPREQDVAFRLSAYRGVKLWLNGRLLLADDKARQAAFDQYVVSGRLEAAVNKVLIKVCQRDGPWQLGLRITNLAGEPLALETGVAISPTPDRSRDGGKTREVSEPESLPQRLTAMPDDPRGIRRLMEATWSRYNGFVRRAVEQAEALVDAHPRCPLYWMTLARAHFEASHQGRALKALRAAERIAPGLPDVLLERSRYEQRHRRSDRALRILAPLTESGPVLPAVASQRIALLQERGFTVDALREAEALLKLQPDRAWLQRTIAELRFGLDQTTEGIRALRDSLQAQASYDGAYDRLIEKHVERGELDTALELVREKSKIFPCLITGAAKEAEILLSRGDFAAALAVCDRLEAVSPDYWYLHKMRGDILYRQGDSPGALQAFRESLRLYPNNPALRDFTDFLECRRDRVFEHYGLGEDAVEEILGKPPDRSAYPDAEAVFLLDDHVTHLFQDGSAAHLVRQIYFVRTQKGTRQFDHFPVPATPSFRLEVAETVKPDGARQESTSIRSGKIHFPSLEPGSLVHVAYRYETAPSAWMEDHFTMDFNFQDQIPEKRVRWVLAIPAGRELKTLKTADFIREVTESFAGEKVFIWSADDAAMIHGESLAPPLRTLRGAVFVSTIPSWDVLARWQNSLIVDQFEIDDEIRRATGHLVATAQTPLEKLQAIYEFVAREIRYLNTDVGIFGKKPNKAINIFENRYGDCKDKATLMIAMLKEVGIDAAYAAVRTVEQGPVFWEVPHAQTNHIITYVPAQPGIEQPLFVDGTSQFGHFLYLPDRDQGLRALVLTGKGFEIRDTPLLPAEASALKNRLIARIAGEVDLDIEGRERWTGWFAYNHRSWLNVEGKRQEELGKELAYRYPGAILREAAFEGLDTLGPEAGATFRLVVKDRLRREGGMLRVNLLWPTNLSRSMARDSVRRYDLFLPTRTRYEIAGTLALPAGYVVHTLPTPFEIDNDLVEFRQKCSQAPGEVTCARTLMLKVRTIPVERYPEFRTLAGQLDAAEAQDLVLVPRRPKSLLPH